MYFIYMIGSSDIDKAIRLAHEHIFSEDIVQKGIVGVKLHYALVVEDSKGEHNSDCARFHN